MLIYTIIRTHMCMYKGLIYKDIYMHRPPHIYTLTYMHVRFYVSYIYIFMHTSTHKTCVLQHIEPLLIHINIFICTYVCMCMYTYQPGYIYIYIHISSNIYIHNIRYINIIYIYILCINIPQ